MTLIELISGTRHRGDLTEWVRVRRNNRGNERIVDEKEKLRKESIQW